MFTVEEFRALNTGSVQVLDRVEISFFDLKMRIVDQIKKNRLHASLEAEDFNTIARNTISDFVTTRRPYVANYVKDNKLMTKTLIADLFNSIVNWGKLTICREDDAIREVQINGPAIWIDKSRGYELLRDPLTNEPIKFENPEEATDFIKSLLVFSGERMTEDEPLINASTIEGFRLSCTHPCVFPPHPSEPTLKWPTATIRKVGGGMFQRQDFLDRETACGPDLDFIALVYESLIGMMVVGTTGCGKTTVSDYGLRHVKDKNRVIAIQAPSEYHYRNMKEGTMQNNAVYWEVSSTADKDSPKSATQDNLVTHSLRNTADLLYLGELRNGSDFGSASRANNAGTKTSSTFHTFSVSGAIDRYALELTGYLGIDIEMGRELACEYLDTVTVCDRLGDGTRKIMGIAEILGYDRTTKSYKINYLFEFVLVDSIEREDGSGLIDNVGYFVKRHSPDQQTIRQMIKQGVSKKRLERITSIPDGTVLREVKFDCLPKDYVVNYDYDIKPLKNSARGINILSKEDSVGIRI